MKKQYKYNRQEQLRKNIQRREKRKMRARGEREESIWFGLGTFGIIGWSVSIPTVIGVAIGIWMDRKWPGSISWTVTMMIVGVAFGCYNSWYWITKNRKYIDEQKDKDKDE